MHIADFSTGQLGANAIVGGSVPIATGAAMALRHLRHDEVVCCFAGDGAYANGVVLESLNWVNQEQWTNFLAGDRPFGLPIVFVIQNNHYGMTHRTDDEVMGVPWLAQRAAGFSTRGMHAEVVNGMDVLAVRDAVTRATEICRAGEGPVLIESSTYRYYGHSLSDPRNEYRTKDEEEAWRAVDPIAQLGRALTAAGVLDEAGLAAAHAAAAERNARAARRAAAGTDPDPEDVLRYLYAGTMSSRVPAEAATPAVHIPIPRARATADGILYRDALRDALAEEMERDARVIFYGEDVADYGGAFKLTKGLLEAFGRERVFNTPISEAAICGTAVGAAMAGLRPVVELMYMDFALMASDQIANQAGKWHYMSGAQTTVPLVIRASVGAGKGYGGQHSQSLESVFTHLPGLVVVYPATAADAKGLLKSAIRSDDPVLFVESQGLYATRGHVPDDPDLLVPIGRARIAREGSDATIVAWGPAVPDALVAAERLAAEGVESEVIDLRTLVPLDMEPVLASVRRTGRCVVAAQAVLVGSYVNEIVARIVDAAFDDLDAPVARVGARNGISPQAQSLEQAFLPTAEDIAAAVRGLM
jgi:2-oxoisovalerate dehydrogenase E1 component